MIVYSIDMILKTFDVQIFNPLLVKGCNLEVGKSIGQGTAT